MNPATLLRAFCDAVEAGDGTGLAALFTPDGVYHDVFYGEFAGRERIAAMLRDWFYRDAEDFRWDMHQPVCDGTTLYARYVFSFRSRLPDAAGRRAMFEGISIMTLRNGLIATYREVADTAPGLVDLGFAPERIARIAARQGAALKARPEAARHIAGTGDNATSTR
jgi:ketosteroid isomerase-like protein